MITIEKITVNDLLGMEAQGRLVFQAALWNLASWQVITYAFAGECSCPTSSTMN